MSAAPSTIESADAFVLDGVEHLRREDRVAAIASLIIGICYGSDDAMLWLGFAFADEAKATGDMGLHFRALGWFALAALAGVEHGEQVFGHHFAELSDDYRAVWAEASPYTWAGVAVH
ncbi:hypothetical protein [Sphingosinicella sp.]|uniref:hypothetical protein n=1 Tax=Sphingosinicella sp. TaxID=1917971 RepID=UPI002613156E|nr:hypothetical protein [Sphingosinicella sp.]